VLTGLLSVNILYIPLGFRICTYSQWNVDSFSSFVYYIRFDILLQLNHIFEIFILTIEVVAIDTSITNQ